MTEEEQGLSKETLDVKDGSSHDLNIPLSPVKECLTTSGDTTELVEQPTETANISQNESVDVKTNASKNEELIGFDNSVKSDEKENIIDANETANESVGQIKEYVEPFIKEECDSDVPDDFDFEFQPKVIKLVNVKGDPLMCHTCSYQTRHLRWLRHHESICEKQAAMGSTATAIPKGTLIFARPAGISQQLVINSEMVKMIYPAQTMRLITPHQSSTADLISRSNAAGVPCPQLMTTVMTSNVNSTSNTAPGNQTTGQNSLQCQLCSFIAMSHEILDNHIKTNHAPVYSCNYCNFKTKRQEEIKGHLDFQCAKRPPKCYTCLVCGAVMYQVEDITVHFREDHPGIPLNSGNIPVRMGFVPRQPSPQVLSKGPQAQDMRPPMLQMLSPQAPTIDGFHICRYCPMKAKTYTEVDAHMKTCQSQYNKKGQKAGAHGKIDLRTSSQDNSFESLEFIPPQSSPTFTATTVIGRPKCAGKRRQDMSYVIQDKIDSIRCSPKEKNVGCTLCEFRTTTNFNLRRHINRMHKDEAVDMKKVNDNDNAVSCQYCNERTTLALLHRHIKNKHPEMMEVQSPVVACPYCEFTTRTNYNLRRHVQNKHPEKVKKPSVTPNNSILRTVACQYCDFQTNSEYNLSSHIKKSHSKPAPANDCPRVSPVKEQSSAKKQPKQPRARQPKEPRQPKAPKEPKEPKEPKAKTCPCTCCEFKTAWSQNLRRHYEKCHKEMYQRMYPERYAKEEEARKAHQAGTTPDQSIIAEVVITENIPDQLVSAKDVVTENIPDQSVSATVVVTSPTPLPASESFPQLILTPNTSVVNCIGQANVCKTLGESTQNSVVNSVVESQTSNLSSLIDRPNEPKDSISMEQNAPIAPTPAEMMSSQIVLQNTIRPHTPGFPHMSHPNQIYPTAPCVIPVQANSINHQLCGEPKVVPLVPAYHDEIPCLIPVVRDKL